MADNEFKISLLGQLDENGTRQQINQDITNIQNKINKLNIGGNINQTDINNINNQLKTLQGVLSDIKVSPTAINNLVTQINNALSGIQIQNIAPPQSSATAVGAKIGQQVQNGINSVLKDGSFTKQYSFGLDRNDIGKKAQAEFQALTGGIVTLKERMQELDGSTQLSGFTVSIKNAKGEVESLRYSLRALVDDQGNKTGDAFEFIGGTINDSNAVKQFDKIQAKITEFQNKYSTFLTKFQNLNIDTSTFDAVFARFQSGSATLNELSIAYTDMSNAAKKASQDLRSQVSSFDPIQQTMNNMRDFPTEIASLETSLNSLKDKSSVANVSIADLRAEHERLQNEMVANGGKVPTSDAWIQSYRNLASTIAETTKKVDALKKAEASDSSFASEQQKYYNNIIQNNRELYALKAKLLNANEAQTKEINKQIKALQQRNKYNQEQITKKGLKDDALERKVNNSKVALENRQKINELRTKELALVEKINTKVANQQVAKDLGGTSGVISKYNSLVPSAIPQQLKDDYANLISLSEKLETNLSKKEKIKTWTEYNNALARVKNQIKDITSAETKLATKDQRLKLASDIEAWNQKNSNAKKAVKTNQEYIASLRNMSNAMPIAELNKMKQGFKENENQARSLGQLGVTVMERLKAAASKFAGWTLATSSIMLLVRKLKEAVNELKNIDTQLTEISKTNNDLSKSDLRDIGNNSFDVASKYGKKATDYLSGVQEMSRAGYKSAEGLAELSTAAQGAGDMTADLANQYLIATDKAFKLNGSVTELTKVLDGSNTITNNNATNMSELSEAMTVVASTASAFGVEVDETTAALGTMIAVTQQSGSEVARAFKAILLNIKQVSDEEEGIDAEGLTKYEKACNALNVKLKETKDGVMSLRDPMEVLRDLSEEYTKLEANDIRRANLLNSLGGKVYHVA